MTFARVRPINGLPLAGPLDGSEIIPGTQGGAAVGLNLGKITDAVSQKFGFDPGVISSIQTTTASLQSGKADKSALGTAAGFNSPVIATAGTIPQFYNVDGTGIPGLAVTGTGPILRHQAPGNRDGWAFHIDRYCNYAPSYDSNGNLITGFENTALAVTSVIQQPTGEYEDAILSVQRIKGAGFGSYPQNTNLRVVSSNEGNSPFWNSAWESYRTNKTNLPAGTAPAETSPQINLEIVSGNNGPDTNLQKIMIDLITARPQHPTIPGAHVGDRNEISAGVRLVKQGNDFPSPGEDNRFISGFKLGYTAAERTDFTYGFDGRHATFSQGGAVLITNNGGRVAFNEANTRAFYYANGKLNWSVGAQDLFNIDDSGFLYIQGSRVLVSKRQGWTQPAGARSRASFDPATVTTAQLAQFVAALYDDLSVHGLIGP